MQQHLSHFTESQWGKDNLNRYVFSLNLKDKSVRDDVTSGGRLFHVLASTMGNARSQMVRRRVHGTASAEVNDDRRRRRPASSATCGRQQIICNAAYGMRCSGIYNDCSLWQIYCWACMPVKDMWKLVQTCWIYGTLFGPLFILECTELGWFQ